MNSIENQRTIKIEITHLLSDTQKNSISDTVRDSSKIFNLFADIGCENRSVSYMTMHHIGYDIAKRMCPELNTATIQQTAKVALQCIRSWNTKYKDKKWQYPGRNRSSSYPLNKLTLSRRGDLTTFSTNGSRIRILHTLPEWFEKRYPEKKLQAGSVMIGKKDRYYIHLVFAIPNTAMKEEGRTVGVDRGLYHHIATSDGILYSSKHIHSVERRYSYNRSMLQSKGTPSARRRLRAMSGREKRFKQDIDHCVSRMLSEQKDVKCYVLEDLVGLTKGRRRKKMNRWLHRWSPGRFFFDLSYKCHANGIEVTAVDPKYTSQMCSACGSRDKNARKGNLYLCRRCGHREHADLNAAKNIRDRHLLLLAEESGRIQPSVCSDV